MAEAMAEYPVNLTPDNGAFLITSPDFPELTTFGKDVEDALSHAVGAFLEAIAARRAYGHDIPEPSKPDHGQRVVHVPD